MATVRETYALRHEGSIVGVAGVWPAGATVTVERDTATGLATVVQVLPGEGGETEVKPDPETSPDAPVAVPDAGRVTPPVPSDGPVAGEFVIPAPMRFSDDEEGN